MANRTARRGETVSYRNADGETTNVLVTGHQVDAPPTPASSTLTTGGTLVPGTYSYRISKVVDGVETQASVAKSQVVPAGTNTNTVTVDWTTGADTRATAYKVYGRASGTELLIATVSMPTTTYTDTGSVTPAGALPAATTAVTVRNPTTHATITGVAKATTQKQTNVYFNRL